MRRLILITSVYLIGNEATNDSSRRGAFQMMVRPFMGRDKIRAEDAIFAYKIREVMQKIQLRAFRTRAQYSIIISVMARPIA